MISLLGLLFKLLPTAKLLKITLAGTVLLSWSILFNWQIALIIIGILIVHEYGHIVAMKQFNIPVKGIYLIPLFGGITIGERPMTHFQNLYISMMGLLFGSLMSVILYTIFLLSDNAMVGLFSSFCAFINIFNLLPVYPLDGGHVIKYITFSMSKMKGIVFLLVISLFGFSLSFYYDLTLLSFFIFLGLLDLIVNWKDYTMKKMQPMSMPLSLLCLIWYLLSFGFFLYIIYAIEATGVLGSNIVTAILKT